MPKVKEKHLRDDDPESAHDRRSESSALTTFVGSHTDSNKTTDTELTCHDTRYTRNQKFRESKKRAFQQKYCTCSSNVTKNKAIERAKEKYRKKSLSEKAEALAKKRQRYHANKRIKEKQCARVIWRNTMLTQKLERK